MSRVPPPTISDRELLELIVEAEFGEGDGEAQGRLDAALAGDADGQRRADEVYRTWDLLGTLPAPRATAPHLLQRRAIPLMHRARPRIAPLVGRAVAASLAVAAAGLGVVAILHEPDKGARGFIVATQRAEHRIARLPDGSSVELSGDTEVRVRYSERGRNITLVRGEALFEVAHNPARPFIVKAGNGEVRALGTAFDVALKRSGVRVTVTKGVVRVTAAAAAGQRSATLRVGQQLSYGEPPSGGSAAAISAPRAVDVASALDWRQGLLEFHGEPLSEVIEEVNRHTTGRVELIDQREAGTPIYGVLRAGDLDGLASILRDRKQSAAQSGETIRIHRPID